MTWTAKPSRQDHGQRRNEPCFTQTMRDELEARYVPRYETRRACTLPALHMVQHHYGWVPPQAIEEIADCLGTSPGEVLDTASFYEEYSLAPKGRCTVAVCRSIACEFCDHKAVTQACREKLGIEVGQSTEDGRFALIEIECIGACGGAPAALVGETLVQDATPETIAAAIDNAPSTPEHH